MAVTKLEKPAWRDCFDQVSRGLSGKRTEAHVAAPEADTPQEGEWAPLLRVLYDPGNDLIEIILEDVHQMIVRPQEVHVDLDAGSLAGMEIRYGDDGCRMLRLREPLMLPPAPG